MIGDDDEENKYGFREINELPMDDRYQGHLTYYINTNSLKVVPKSWLTERFCPACFGVDACSSINKNELMINIPEDLENGPAKKGVFYGKWKLSTAVILKKLSSGLKKAEEFILFDKFICKNVSLPENCDVSKAILNENSYAQKFDVDLLENQDAFNDVWRTLNPDKTKKSLLYIKCLTKNMLESFERMYDFNHNSRLDPDEKAIFFTSIIVQPESLMLRFMKRKAISFIRVAPRFYGACGRLIIVEHGGRQLSWFLESRWYTRADIALQLLSLVKVFWHPDHNFFLLYKEFKMENLVISHDRQVNIIDYEQMSIIEKLNSSDEAVHNEEHDSKHRCNQKCFDNMWLNLNDEFSLIKFRVNKKDYMKNNMRSLKSVKVDYGIDEKLSKFNNDRKLKVKIRKIKKDKSTYEDYSKNHIAGLKIIKMHEDILRDKLNLLTKNNIRNQFKNLENSALYGTKQIDDRLNSKREFARVYSNDTNYLKNNNNKAKKKYLKKNFKVNLKRLDEINMKKKSGMLERDREELTQLKCHSIHQTSGAYMYSTLCRNILSNLVEHVKNRDSSSNLDGSNKFQGLLHSIPDEEPEDKKKKVDIERALIECVEESEPGARTRAISQLTQILMMDVRGIH